MASGDPVGGNPARTSSVTEVAPGSAAGQAARVALGEFTKNLLQTVDRASYYEPGHPAHYALSDELYGSLAGFLTDQPQIGYTLQRGVEPEVLVDGLPIGRVRLNEILLGGQYDLFVPRLIDYFDRHELVMLAFRKGITKQEFGVFINIFCRPVDPKNKVKLNDTLLAEGVVNISILVAEDIGDQDAHLPWQVRICMARLRRDLRSVPLYKHLKPEEMRKIKLQIFADVVRPLNSADQIKLLVVHAPRIEKDLARVEGLEELKIARNVVSALTAKRLFDLTRVLTDDLSRIEAERDIPMADLTNALLLCTLRLQTEEIPDSDKSLRALYDGGVIEFDELPEDLQEWLEAEALRARGKEGAAAEAETGTPRQVRVLGKTAHLTYRDGDIDATVAIVEQLKEVAGAARDARVDDAMQALDGIVYGPELQELVDKLEAISWREAEPIVRLLRALGKRVARALAERIVHAGENARFGNAYHVLDAMPDVAPEPVAEVLRRQNPPPAPVLRVMLALAQRHPTSALASASRQYVSSADKVLRLAGLGAASALDTDDAANLLKQALDDPELEIVVFAMTALAQRFGQEAVMRSQALKMLDDSKADTPDEILCDVMRLLVKHPGGEGERAASTYAVQRFHEKETNRFFKLSSKPDHPKAVELVEATLKALATAASPRESGARPGGRRIRDLFRK